MVDPETSPAKTLDRLPQPQASRSVRGPALWAAAFAVPIAVLAGVLIFWRVAPHDGPAAGPAPSSTALASVPSTPVQLSAARLPAPDAQACRAMTARLPARVRNLPARQVSAGPEQNAAYGEPPITVQCGVAQPAMCKTVTPGQTGCVPLDADLLVMNGVCWYGDDGPATKLFTTMDRQVAVQVGVPASYDQAGQWANEFSDAVAGTIRTRAADVPTGCGN